jgi:hypothetical protein
MQTPSKFIMGEKKEKSKIKNYQPTMVPTWYPPNTGK